MGRMEFPADTFSQDTESPWEHVTACRLTGRQQEPRTGKKKKKQGKTEKIAGMESATWDSRKGQDECAGSFNK